MDIKDLAPIAIAFVVIAIVLGVGADVLDTIQDSQTENSTAYNASGNGLSGLEELSGWLPTLATVVAASVVIGVIALYFMRLA
jgi:hypothetical protein